MSESVVHLYRIYSAGVVAQKAFLWQLGRIKGWFPAGIGPPRSARVQSSHVVRSLNLIGSPPKIIRVWREAVFAIVCGGRAFSRVAGGRLWWAWLLIRLARSCLRLLPMAAVA